MGPAGPRGARGRGGKRGAGEGAGERLARRCEEARAEVEASACWGELRVALGDAGSEFGGWGRLRRIVLLGLGSLEDGSVACRHQFGLATLLARELASLGDPTTPPALMAHDPAFTELDWDVLAAGGWEKPPEKTAAASVSASAAEGWWDSRGTPTLFFMPHCEAELYEGVLAANWNPVTLNNVAILGNSFEEYDLRWSMPQAMGKGQKRPQRLLSLLPHTREDRVPDRKYHVVSAFNSLSLHSFPREGLPAEGEAFWMDPGQSATEDRV